MVIRDPLRLLVVALLVACGGESTRRGGAGASAGSGGAGASAGSGNALGGTGDGTAGQAAEPGCAPEDVERCNEPPGEFCTAESCIHGGEWGPGHGILERGDGVICKYEPDSVGPDFACLQGEWCQFELHECRCGDHAGCQIGEHCAACAGTDCAPGRYDCVRDVACTFDDLDTCAAEPGQDCNVGDLQCAGPDACTLPANGATHCPDAPLGCCPANEWCFDGEECRCGVDPSCTGDDTCELNSVGLYRCGGRVR
jgi:hypothetical protein